jgi:SAP domain
MSRQIDVSHPESLSDEDKQYLRDRGRVDIVSELNRLAAVESARAIPERHKALERESFRARRQRGLMNPVKPAIEDPTNVKEVPPYDQWSRDELVAELKARNLPTTGKNAELVDRLEENDAQDGVK